MNRSTAQVVKLGIVPVLLIALLAGCASASTPAPSGPAGGGGGGGAGSSSGTGGTGGGGGTGVGGLNGAPDLEAQLPSTACGQPVKKSSFSGSGSGLTPDASANPMLSMLGAFGTGGNVSIAIAEPTSSDCNVSYFAYRVAGSNQQAFQMILSAIGLSAGGSGNVNVGGKAVLKIPDTPTSTYLYVKGDTIFAVSAPTDDAAAPGLSALP
jgi:hypothetical protein